MLSRPKLCRSIFCRASLGLLVAWTTRVDAQPLDTDPRLLVLANGQVLRGQVSLHGDSYLVTLPYGEIRVPVENVEHVCRDLEEALRFKQSAIRFGSAQQHLQLADWCLDHGLHQDARRELAIANSLQPGQRLAVAIAQRLAAATQKSSGVAQHSVFQQPTTDTAQLDALVRRMPPGTVETFTNTIQPLLINGCSARACHGSAATNDFRLRRFPHGQKPRRLVTLRNLEAVLQWVDQDDPAASRILYAATHPHGVSRQSSLLSEPAQRKLSQWLYGLRTLDHSAQPADEDVTPEAEASVVAARAKSLYNPAESGNAPTSTADRQQRSSYSAQPARPRDPFDPEIFNRRYHGP